MKNITSNQTTLTKIRIGHSPDSDDAFMFHATTNGKIDLEGIEFAHELHDIQTLNEWAKDAKLETTAISVHAYAHVRQHYSVLTHGASMGGESYGPSLVVMKDKFQIPSYQYGKDQNNQAFYDQIKNLKFGIPGEMTSAFLALKLFLPFPLTNYKIIPFNQIMDEVVKGTVDVGLLIHEGQLTHESLGLTQIANLGVWWWKKTNNLPLPLGVNVIRKNLGSEMVGKVSRIMKRSIEYALNHRSEALDYAMRYAGDMPKSLADQFVGMYVNNWTLDLGAKGQESIKLFLKEAEDRGFIAKQAPVEFVS